MREEVTSASVWHVLGLQDAVSGPVTWPFVFRSHLMPCSCVCLHVQKQMEPTDSKFVHIRQNEKLDLSCERRAEADEGDEGMLNQEIYGFGRVAVSRLRTDSGSELALHRCVVNKFSCRPNQINHHHNGRRGHLPLRDLLHSRDQRRSKPS